MSTQPHGVPNYAAALDAAPASFLLLYPDFRIAGATDAYLAATMTARNDIIGRGLFDVFPDNPNDPAADGVRNLRASLDRVLASKKPDRMALQKYDVPRPESAGGAFEERYWSPVNTPVIAADGSVELIIHWVEDVTEFVLLKKQMQRERDAREKELRSREHTGTPADQPFLRHEAVEANKRLIESERRYRFLADAVPQLIWTADQDGQFDYFNARWLTYTGRTFEQLRGDGWHTVIHVDDLPRTIASWHHAREAGGEFHIEHRVCSHDGSWRWMLTLALPYRDASGHISQWFGSTTDIHERVEGEEKMRAAQRLQAVGTLAGGMAHEVNNMMTAVLGFGELVTTALGVDHPQRPDVDEMIRAGVRAAQVTRQLLAFSRQQVLKPAVVDVGLIVNELGALLRRLAGSDRRLDIKSPPYPVRVVADRGQLEQVLINLAANARDATHTNGIIAIETEAVSLDQETLRLHREEGLAAGQYVRLTVRDDGEGMAPDTVARAFEPFFTTKAVGHGTGLGLSMVYGIAKQSGGYAHIESTPGAGAAVSVYLPLVDAEATISAEGQAASRGRGERILVVEDETVVRSLARRGLEAAGYTVYQAPNGAAALQFLSTKSGMIDLVLTDVVMPNMNGRQLAEAIAKQHPGLPLLFMSGYSGDEISRRGLMVLGASFIQKPFTLEALASAVRQRLDQAVGEAPRAPA